MIVDNFEKNCNHILFSMYMYIVYTYVLLKKEGRIWASFHNNNQQQKSSTKRFELNYFTLVSLQAQLEEVKGQVPEIKEENLHLIQEKQSLGQELERQRLQVLELQDQLDVLRNQTTQERKMRANVALKISENIAQERESLVKELDMLRSVNTKVSYLNTFSTWLVE